MTATTRSSGEPGRNVSVSAKTLIASAWKSLARPLPAEAIVYVTFPASYFSRGRLSTLKQILLKDSALQLKSVRFTRVLPFKIEVSPSRPLFEGFPLLELRLPYVELASLFGEDFQDFTIRGFRDLRVAAVLVGSSMFTPQDLVLISSSFSIPPNRAFLLPPMISFFSGSSAAALFCAGSGASDVCNLPLIWAINALYSAIFSVLACRSISPAEVSTNGHC